MRRILIDDNIERLAECYLKDLTDRAKTGWREMPKRRLMMIYRGLTGDNERLKCYVSLLLSQYEKIILLRSEEFDDFHKQYFCIWDEEMGTEVTVKKKTLPLSEAVKWAFRYDDLRDSFIPEHLDGLGVRTCVYCNEKSIGSGSEKDKNGKDRIISRYQIDHYYPQSKYPYLCTSFYNLQPSCDSCNQGKSDDWSQFNLYTSDDNKLDVFRFSIGSDDQILYAMIEHDASKLQIELHSDEDGLLANHECLFHVESVCQKNHRKDALKVMDILYNQKDSYINSLKAALGQYIPMANDEIMDEYFRLFGYDMHKNQVHRRPLNKMAQDIVEFYEKK